MIASATGSLDSDQVSQNRSLPGYDEEEDPDLPLAFGNRFVITESSTGRKAWEFFLLVTLVYISVIFPYRLSFVHFKLNPAGSSCKDFQDPLGWQIWDWMVDIFFWIDLVLGFCFSYRKSDGTEEIRLYRIVINYLSGFFVLNLLACLPSQAFVPLVELLNIDPGGCSTSTGASLNETTRLARLQRVTRLARLARLLRILKIVRMIRHLVEYCSRWLNWAFFMVFVVHLMACGWYLCASMHTNHVDTWVGRRVIPDADSPDGEISLLSLPEFFQWVHSIYFVLTVFTTVGFGDMYALTVAEIWFVSFAMLVGTVVHSILVGEIINFIVDGDDETKERRRLTQLVTAFSQHAMFRRQFKSTLTEWVEEKSGGKEMFDRVEMRKLMTSGAIPRKLLGQMSEHLSRGHLMKNRLLKTCTESFIGGAPPRFSLLLATMLHAQDYKAGDTVFQLYDHSSNLYLVMKGTFACVARLGPYGTLVDAVSSNASGVMRSLTKGNSGMQRRTANPPETDRRYSSKDREEGGISSRLDQETSAWTPESSKTGQWLQIDLGSAQSVCGIVVQGHPIKEQWVTAYKVKVSRSRPDSWDEPDEEFTCNGGSTDKDSLAEVAILCEARFVRIEPLSWHGKISMRVGVLLDNARLHPYKLFGKLNWFGDEVPAGVGKRNVTVRCEADGEVMLLHKSDFLRTGGLNASLLEEFAEIRNVVKIIAIHRIQSRKDALKRHPNTASLTFKELAAYHIQREWRQRHLANRPVTMPSISRITSTSSTRRSSNKGDDLERKVNGLIADVACLRSDFTSLRSDFTGLQTDFTSKTDKVAQALEKLAAAAPTAI